MIRLPDHAHRRKNSIDVRAGNRPHATAAGPRNRREKRRYETSGADRDRPARRAPGPADCPGHAVLRSSDIPFGVDNMDLVMVDDVLYTGRTVRAAMNGLFDLGRPKRVSLCVLIDRGHREIDKEERVVLVDRVE